MNIKPIIFGATGMVGQGVLSEALKHSNVESVLVIGRRSCNVKHNKLKEIVHHDFFDYSIIEEQLKGYNACFFCLGVSSVGMNERDYKHITYDLTMHSANTLSRLNPEMTFCYVSGAGTDSSEMGRMMWSRVKGKTENHLTKLDFDAVYLFRPALIKPANNQKNVKKIFKAVGLLYPFLNLIAPKYICTVEEIGTAMIKCVDHGYTKQILENKDIVLLAHLKTSKIK